MSIFQFIHTKLTIYSYRQIILFLQKLPLSNIILVHDKIIVIFHDRPCDTPRLPNPNSAGSRHPQPDRIDAYAPIRGRKKLCLNFPNLCDNFDKLVSENKKMSSASEGLRPPDPPDHHMLAQTFSRARQAMFPLIF